MNVTDFPERSRQLLKTLVERYIREGQPVGSKALVEESALSVSSATARNIMADLEERGYLLSPHTSAGRVPTDLAYRVFVDSLATYRSLQEEEVSQLVAELSPDQPSQALVSAASSLISDTTQLAGVVLLPRRNQIRLRRIEFLPLSGQRVLAIMVINEQEVQNRIFRCEESCDELHLTRVANYLNQHFSGEPLDLIRKQLNVLLVQHQDSLRELVQSSINLAEKAFDDLHAPEELVVAGESHLLEMAKDSQIDSVKAVFEALEEKRGMLHLLDQCIASDEARIFIGAESGYSAFFDCSIVAAPYSNADNVLGVLAVVGPTRMNYEHVVPTVDITAKILSTALNQFS
jgi:heat-inducible transcriptional repressor